MSENNFETITKQFLNSTKNISSSSKKIFSLAYPIDKTEILKVVDSLKSENIDFLSFSSRINNIKFIGIKSIWELRSFEKSSEKINVIKSLSKNIISNHNLFSVKQIPFFLSTIKFNENEKSELWNEFPNVYWFVPQIVFYQNGLNSYLILNFYSNNLSELQIQNLLKFATNMLYAEHKILPTATIKRMKNDSEYFNWTKKIESFLEQIRNNEISKIVFSRQVVFEIISEISLFDLINKLENNYPETTVFMHKKNNSIFFGATPELLLSIESNMIKTDALAGSAPRGATETEDTKFENDLLSNLKNRNEQKYVVNFIVDSLLHVTRKIEFESIPKVKKLSNIQHLWTSIKADISDNHSAISLINLIYPTPAICGIPSDKAKQKIIESENHSRGLYSGIVGWLDEKLNGYFYVAIRSALIQNHFLYLFAGCGIVDGSDPKLEFEETELKLNPILSLFKNEKTN